MVQSQIVRIHPAGVARAQDFGYAVAGDLGGAQDLGKVGPLTSDGPSACVVVLRKGNISPFKR